MLDLTASQPPLSWDQALPSSWEYESCLIEALLRLIDASITYECLALTDPMTVPCIGCQPAKHCSQAMGQEVLQGTCIEAVLRVPILFKASLRIPILREIRGKII